MSGREPWGTVNARDGRSVHLDPDATQCVEATAERLGLSLSAAASLLITDAYDASDESQRAESSA